MTAKDTMQRLSRNILGLGAALEVLLAFFASSLAGAALMVGVGLVAGPSSLQTVLPSGVVDLFPLILTFFYLRYRKLTWHQSEAVEQQYPSVITASLALSITAALLYSVVYSRVTEWYTGAQAAQSLDLPQLSLTYNHREVINAFVLLLPVPLLEELIFRGGAMVAMKGYVRGGTAVLVSAALFAVAHLAPNQMAGAFLVGSISGTALLASGRLLPSVLVHVAWNATLMIWTLDHLPFSRSAETSRSLDDWVALPAAIGVLISGTMLYHLTWPSNTRVREVSSR